MTFSHDHNMGMANLTRKMLDLSIQTSISDITITGELLLLKLQDSNLSFRGNYKTGTNLTQRC